jgi:hypothetical protein
VKKWASSAAVLLRPLVNQDERRLIERPCPLGLRPLEDLVKTIFM